MTSDLYAQIEPLLKEAGYKGKIKSPDGLALWKGHTSISIYHHPMPYDTAYERVCFSFVLKSKEAKQVPNDFALWLSNRLSYSFAEFSFICFPNNQIYIRYVCDIVEPQDLLTQLRYAVVYFGHVRKEYKRLLKEYLENYNNDNEQ